MLHYTYTLKSDEWKEGGYEIELAADFDNFGKNMYLHQRQMFIESMTPTIRDQNTLISKLGTLIGLNERGVLPSNMEELEEMAEDTYLPIFENELVVDTCDEDITEKHKQILQSFIDNWGENKKLIRSYAYESFKRIIDSYEDPSTVFSQIKSEEDIDDFFSIYSLVITEETVMKLCGPALWDEEHGFRTGWGELNLRT